MPADVADDGVHEAVLGLYDVEEVTAEQGLFPPGEVPGGGGHAGRAEQRQGQQPPFQARVLLGTQPALSQGDPGEFGLLALDGVADRALQQLGVDLALDEVVLGPRRERLDPGVGLGQAGQDDDGRLGAGVADRVDGLEAGHVGQVQVEQDAVGRAGGEFGAGLGDGTALYEGVREVGVVEQFLDQQRVARVVLDQQDAQVAEVADTGREGSHAVGSSVVAGTAARRTGRVKTTRVPGAYSGSMPMVPPWNSTTFLHMARPIPVPG
ncbi:hypothetical protein QFZ64_000625 [Streptomyces sp. B3I8]|nr:hypothetical protein [Streptomyces sp. B3I8]